jgi:hypothetical protein
MEKDLKNDSPSDLNNILYEGITSHGFLLQEKCASTIEECKGTTNWYVAATEYPISTQIKDTRIDFICQYNKSNDQQPNMFAVVECKKVNLDYVTGWLFGNPLLPDFNEPLLISLRERKPSKYIGKTVDYFQLRPNFNRLSMYLIDNWWLEIGSNKKSTPQPLEDTFTQVCLGVTGLILEQDTLGSKTSDKIKAIYIPIVLTNAPLYVSTYNVEDISLTNGNIPKGKIHFGAGDQPPERIDWVVVDYGISRKANPDKLYSKISDIEPSGLELLHKRSIFIVNCEKIEEFFSRLQWDIDWE